ncbi:MAG: hypothetical protein EBS01_13505, partial [Verrucomicrobia bacterium]|nr:hypothetical protein [Verrucomicrobiota bacterium]
MSLDVAKLENVSRSNDGKITARCPACKNEGHDSKGNHLVVFDDGGFGCVKYMGDSGHRKEIAKLAGQAVGGPHQRGRITVSPFIAPVTTVILDLGCFERFSSEVTRSWNTELHEPVPKREDYEPEEPAPEVRRGGLTLSKFAHIPPR